MKGPLVNQTVGIDFPGAPRIGARVEKAARGHLALSLLGARSAPGELRSGDEVAVLYSTDRGVYRLRGTLRRGLLGKGLRFDFDGEGSLVQRREYNRLPWRVVARLYLRERGGDVLDTYTQDISVGGAAVKDSIGLRMGEVVSLGLRFTREETPILAVGVVVLQVDRDFKGVKFTSIGRRDRERLEDHLKSWTGREDARWRKVAEDADLDFDDLSSVDERDRPADPWLIDDPIDIGGPEGAELATGSGEPTGN